MEFPVKLASLLAIGIASASFGNESAQAAPITFDFSGTISSAITDPLGAFSGVGAGTVFSGSYTFESTTSDAALADTTIGRYTNALTAFSLTIGSHVLTFPGAGSPNQIVVRNPVSPVDSYNVLADFAGIGGYSDIDLLSLGGVGPLTLFASDALPLTSSFFSSLSTTRFQIGLYTGVAPNKTRVGGMVGTLTSLELRQVPEPGSLALLGLGLAGLAAARRRKH